MQNGQLVECGIRSAVLNVPFDRFAVSFRPATTGPTGQAPQQAKRHCVIATQTANISIKWLSRIAAEATQQAEHDARLILIRVGIARKER